MTQGERADTFSRSTEQPVSGGGDASGRISIDQFEMKRQWLEREEEERVEAAAVLYERAVRQRIQACSPNTAEPENEEELEAMSQELKLRQKCQDIAAQILVDELEDSLDDDEAE